MSRRLSPYLGDQPGYSVRQGGTGGLVVSPRNGRPGEPALYQHRNLAYWQRRRAYWQARIGGKETRR